jgi:hypothetical protein
MYSVNTKSYNWPPTVSPCKMGQSSYSINHPHETNFKSCGCGPQYPNNRSLCPYKKPDCPCSPNCFQGTGNCPCRAVYDDLMQTGPLCIPNGCVYQGPTLQGNPTFGYKKPIPLPYVNYTPAGDPRSPFDNSPGCLAFKNRVPF